MRLFLKEESAKMSYFFAWLFSSKEGIIEELGESMLIALLNRRMLMRSFCLKVTARS